MINTKKDIRQFESFDGRFMSIRIGISKSVLDSMTDEDRMTLGSMISCFEGDMFGLLKDYAEGLNSKVELCPPWEESTEKEGTDNPNIIQIKPSHRKAIMKEVAGQD